MLSGPGFQTGSDDALHAAYEGVSSIRKCESELMGGGGFGTLV